MDKFIEEMITRDPRLSRISDVAHPDLPAVCKSISTFIRLFQNVLPGIPAVTPVFCTENEEISIDGKKYNQSFLISYQASEKDRDTVAILALGRFENELDTFGVFSFGEEKQGIFQSQAGEDWIQSIKRFVEMIRWKLYSSHAI